MAESKDKLKDFEKSLQHLEKIVSNMESGELGLEESSSNLNKESSWQRPARIRC